MGWVGQGISESGEVRGLLGRSMEIPVQCHLYLSLMCGESSKETVEPVSISVLREMPLQPSPLQPDNSIPHNSLAVFKLLSFSRQVFLSSGPLRGHFHNQLLLERLFSALVLRAGKPRVGLGPLTAQWGPLQPRYLSLVILPQVGVGQPVSGLCPSYQSPGSFCIPLVIVLFSQS